METSKLTLAALRAAYADQSSTPTHVVQLLLPQIAATPAAFTAVPSLEDVLERCK